MTDSLKGRRRTVNPVGEERGPYVVDRPVGAKWETSMYFVLRCKLGCGFEVQKKRDLFTLVNKEKCCGGCKGTGIEKEDSCTK
jgi:hypothetical protein